MLINEDPSVSRESPVINTDREHLLLVLGVLQLLTLAYTFYNQLYSLYAQDGEHSERMFRNLERISWLNSFLEGLSFFVSPIYLAMSIQEDLDGSLDNRHGPNLPNVAYINIVIPMLLFLGNLCYDWGDPH